MKELFRFRVTSFQQHGFNCKDTDEKFACLFGRLIIRLCFDTVTRNVVILSSDRWH